MHPYRPPHQEYCLSAYGIELNHCPTGSVPPGVVGIGVDVDDPSPKQTVVGVIAQATRVRHGRRDISLERSPLLPALCGVESRGRFLPLKQNEWLLTVVATPREWNQIGRCATRVPPAGLFQPVSIPPMMATNLAIPRGVRRHLVQLAVR